MIDHDLLAVGGVEMDVVVEGVGGGHPPVDVDAGDLVTRDGVVAARAEPVCCFQAKNIAAGQRLAIRVAIYIGVGVALVAGGW